MFRSNMILRVDFLAGTDIMEAIVESRQKAIDFDLAGINFKFNGIEMYITQNTDIKEAYDEYIKGY